LPLPALRSPPPRAAAAAMPISLEAWFQETPVVTRTYLTLAFLTTTACSLDVRAQRSVRSVASLRPALRLRAQLISPFTVYYNTRLIFREFQLWRLVTNFLFFGSLGARRERALLRARAGEAGGDRLPARRGSLALPPPPPQAWTFCSTCSS